MAYKKKRILKDKVYRLLSCQPLTYTIKVGRDKNLLVFDETKQYERAIRHAPNERSIFVDEQTNVAVVEPIVFFNGFLKTKSTDIITQDFVEANPKFGTLYELVDNERDAVDTIDHDELIMDIKSAIRNKVKEEGGIEELRAVVSVLISNESRAASMSVPELKKSAYDSIEGNVDRFTDEKGNITIFDDNDIKRKAIAQHAFGSGVIQVSADASRVLWSDNKEVICLIPVGKSHLDFFAKFLETEEGMQVAVEISKRN